MEISTSLQKVSQEDDDKDGVKAVETFMTRFIIEASYHVSLQGAHHCRYFSTPIEPSASCIGDYPKLGDWKTSSGGSKTSISTTAGSGNPK